MKLLLDENIAQTFAQDLRDSRFHILHALEAGLQGMSDEHLLKFAQKQKMVIVTHDKDFGNLIRFPLINHYGVIMLRFRNQRPRNTFPHLVNFLAHCGNLKGRLAVLSEKGYRII